MQSARASSLPIVAGPAQFATTHWSVVLAAGGAMLPKAREALEALCRTYWPPLYAFARRKGFDPESAEDLTQEFFASLLARDDLGSVHPTRGRFRTFLLSSLEHFISNEWRRRGTIKRGGSVEFLPLHATDAEGRLRCDPATDLTPEKLYDRRWAVTLMERALDCLRTEATAAGKAVLFETLREFLAEPPSAGDYPSLAQRLDMKESALRVAVYRLRQRYRALLRNEIAQTVRDPAAVDQEIRELLAALS